MYSHVCLAGGWNLPLCFGLGELVIYVALGVALVLIVERWLGHV
jgi:hypothetical protein